MENINISGIEELVKPKIIRNQVPIDDNIIADIENNRNIIRNILNGSDKRFIAIVGPCSIHNINEALDYARQLKKLQVIYQEKIYIIMRVYFEKPRTTVGWKGLINDPDMDNNCNINKGLLMARTLMLEIARLGLPIGCEFLDTISPQFYSDLVSWGAIGARTTESQCHRQLASGLSMPIGFKNGTSGNIQIAIDAVKSSRHPHTFLGINMDNNSCIVKTKGNQNTHIILRGGRDGPNYETEHIQNLKNLIYTNNILKPAVIIDCSHGNSMKQFQRQELVAEDVGNQKIQGEDIIKGIMLESNINEGNQSISTSLKYGVSITDACVSLEKTNEILNNLFLKL
jgi:3-deoxy-7-phosphoheptulonate synthase